MQQLADETNTRVEEGGNPDHIHRFSETQWNYCNQIVNDVFAARQLQPDISLHKGATDLQVGADGTSAHGEQLPPDADERKSWHSPLDHQLALCSVALNRAIHADVSAHRPAKPGQEDSYRSREYTLVQPLLSMVEQGWSVQDVADKGWHVEQH